MEELKKVTQEMRAQLDTPLPAEAVSQHPTKPYLSSIKSIYVTERLNDVFGVGAWRIASEVVDKGEGGMIVVKVTFTVPEYGIAYECYGGNDNGGEGGKNFDLGDAYKGAVTDAISKISSWLGIGAKVFKGQQGHRAAPAAGRPAQQPVSSSTNTAARTTTQAPKPSKQKRRIMTADLDSVVTCDSLLAWSYQHWANYGFIATFDAGADLLASYDADAAVVERYRALFESYKQAKKSNR